MEPPHAVFNQAGPSNYSVPYAQEGRPQYATARGRGHANHRHANANFHQAQQQPFFTHGVPNSYAGYSLGMNGTGSGPMHGRYGQSPNGVRGRPGPGYHSGNFQPPSPALHPAPMYNHHPTPFIPSVGASGAAPVYPYPPPSAHLHPYPTAFSPPFHHPSPSFPNHQTAKSPSISSLTENAGNLPESWKTQRLFSPRQLPVSPTPLPPQKEAQSSAPPSNLPPLSPAASEEPSPPSAPPAPSPSKSSLPISDTLTSNPNSPLSNSPPSPAITLPSFENEPAPLQEWVISATRPDDPAAAFGIMISPKANPSTHIIEGARKYIAPVRRKVTIKKPLPVDSSDSKEDGSSIALVEPFPEAVTSQTEQVSCSTTETERTSTVPDTFVAGSPVSTATSVSIAGAKADSPSQEESQTLLPVQASPELSSAAESPTATVSASLPHDTAESLVRSSQAKKSWASLLRPDNLSSSKTRLPVSPIQGISIPAQSMASPSSAPVASGSRGKHTELLRLLDNGPSGSSGIPQIRPRGLVNTGNMCFANAILQMLVYTPPFFRLFTELALFKGTDPDSTKWAGKETPLVDATVQFLKEFKPTVKEVSKDSYEDDDDFSAIDSFIPSYVYDAMKEKSRFDKMGGGQQEDAEEFFGFFLDTIEEELLAISKSLKDGSRSIAHTQERDSTDGDDWLEVGKRSKPIVARTVKSADSPMTRIFGGKFRSTLRVPGQRDSVVVEDWRSLKLDIQREQVETIEDALRYISHPQVVHVTSVTKGGAVVEASQQILVDGLPPILVLHLKRFLYDTTARDVIKVHKQVSYGPELEIPSDAITPARRTAYPAKYKLFAVLYHHGSSAAGGHYTLDVLHPNRNADPKAKPREGWIRIDDEIVSDLRTEEVFGKDRDCAYLLFYRRIGAKGKVGYKSS